MIVTDINRVGGTGKRGRERDEKDFLEQRGFENKIQKRQRINKD